MICPRIRLTEKCASSFKPVRQCHEQQLNMLRKPAWENFQAQSAGQHMRCIHHGTRLELVSVAVPLRLSRLRNRLSPRRSTVAAVALCLMKPYDL